MSEITQKLGFDAGDALSALKQLDSALASNEQRLKSNAEALKGFNASSSHTATATRRVADAFRTNMGASTQSVERLTTSLGLLSRITFTQAVIRGLNSMRMTFQGTARSAIDFQRKIAEISTIASGESFNQLAASVRSISDSMNIGLLETASGLYQTLSNSVGDTATSMTFLTEAAKFAKATNSELSDAVDLLSAAVKANGYSFEQTGSVAAIFFEAIKNGRITASELANTYGRIGERSAALNVSLAEQSAALASITVNGVGASEAITFFSGILTALTKPTDELRQKLEQLGFTNAETAIATLGLGGTLESIIKLTDGTSSSIARLFPNVRAIAGAISLTGDGFAQYARNIDSARSATAAFADDKYLQAIGTDANTVTSEINKLRNALTVDLGQGLLRATADTLTYVGGADTMIAATKNLSPLIIGTTTALASYAIGARAAATASTLLASRMGPVGIALVGLGAAKSLGNVLDNMISDRALKRMKELEDSAKSTLKAFSDAEQARLKEVEETNRKQVESAGKLIAELNKSYLQNVANARRADEELVRNVTATTARILAARQRLVTELDRTIGDSERSIRDSMDRVRALQLDAADRQFDLSIKRLDQRQQIFALGARASDLGSQASRALSQAANADEIKKALDLFTRARDVAERGFDLATGDRGLESRAVKTIDELTRKQIAAEERLQALQKQRQPLLERERDRQADIADQVRSQVETIKQNASLFKDGRQLTPEELGQALERLGKLGLSPEETASLKQLGIDAVDTLNSVLTRDPIHLRLTVEGETTRIQQQLDSAFADFRVKLGVDLEPFEQAVGRQLINPDDVARAIAEASKKGLELSQQVSQRSASEQAQQLAKSQVQSAVATAEAALARFDGPAQNSTLAKLLQTFVTDFKSVSEQSTITADDLNRLFSELESVKAKAEGFFGIGRSPLLLIDTATMAEGIAKLNELQTARDNALNVDAAGIANFQSAAALTAQIAANWERAASAAERAAAASNRLSGPSAVSRFHGSTYLANGGRGTDTIPAMLSPGEFVVNAQSSRKFFSQLQAINSGRAPIYRESGGPVTYDQSTHVGDIAITVPGGPTDAATVRSIADKLRREIRRGTI